MLAIALVMLFLFLRPGEALGNTTVTVKKFANEANGQQGVKFGDTVKLEATVDLESGKDLITVVTVGVTQLNGDTGFVNFAITVPVQAGDQTIILPTGSGKLEVNMSLTQVKQVAVTSGYAFGYDGGVSGETGGNIVINAKFTPPAIAGDYTAASRSKPGGREQQHYVGPAH